MLTNIIKKRISAHLIKVQRSMKFFEIADIIQIVWSLVNFDKEMKNFRVEDLICKWENIMIPWYFVYTLLSWPMCILHIGLTVMTFLLITREKEKRKKRGLGYSCVLVEGWEVYKRYMAQLSKWMNQDDIVRFAGNLRYVEDTIDYLIFYQADVPINLISYVVNGLAGSVTDGKCKDYTRWWVILKPDFSHGTLNKQSFVALLTLEDE